MKSAYSIYTVLIVIAVVCAILDIAAIAVLLSPAGRSRMAGVEEFERLRNEMTQKRAQVLPIRDIDAKIVTAREQIGTFYRDRLPGSYAELAETLGRNASKHRVTLSGIRYNSKPAGQQGLQLVTLTVDSTGNYRDVIEFINGLERDKSAFVISGVNFGGSERGRSTLRVGLTLNTYMRSAAS